MRRIDFLPLIVVVAVLMWLAGHFEHVHAHEEPAPASSTPERDQYMRVCQQIAAQTAWGAASRFAGAPFKFEVASEKDLKALFWGIDEANDVKAIYTLDFGDDFTAKRFYEEAAASGWKQADEWVNKGVERPSYEVLLSVFYNGCMHEEDKQK